MMRFLLQHPVKRIPRTTTIGGSLSSWQSHHENVNFSTTATTISSTTDPNNSTTTTTTAARTLNLPKQSLITGNNSVHSTMMVSKNWRNKPLFRRQGDVRFKTGEEAAQLLIQEAMRRDSYEIEFIASCRATLSSLAGIFDRNPKYAFVAKTLVEPERHIQFRVAWIDDTGVVRMNRGYRIQYNSSLGMYAGSLHFGSHITNSTIKALAFDAVISNALVGRLGAAVGGSDFNPVDKSEAELQRFCQSYMTELAKYIQHDIDAPWMGSGVGATEMGYLYGQYKRMHPEIAGRWDLSSAALSGDFPEAPGFGVAHFANEILLDQQESLQGKRCLILGSGKTALYLADKLLEFGAIPIAFSDASGCVYEPTGFGTGGLRTIHKIKSERGALLGRYIIHSTTAEFLQGDAILDIPCDLCFPCEIDGHDKLNKAAISKLADNGCSAFIEGNHATITADGREMIRKLGLLYGPHVMTLTGSAIVHQAGVTTDADLAQKCHDIYTQVKSTASEFNARGDLLVGANILGFYRIANVMMTHGAV